VDGEFRGEKFQQGRVRLPLDSRGCHFDFHSVAVFADDRVALRIRDDAEPEGARSQGFT
jgi:hypothetical protein